MSFGWCMYTPNAECVDAILFALKILVNLLMMSCIKLNKWNFNVNIYIWKSQEQCLRFRFNKILKQKCLHFIRSKHWIDCCCRVMLRWNAIDSVPISFFRHYETVNLCSMDICYRFTLCNALHIWLFYFLFLWCNFHRVDFMEQRLSHRGFDIRDVWVFSSANKNDISINQCIYSHHMACKLKEK